MRENYDEIVARFDTYAKTALRCCLYKIRNKRDKLDANEKPFTVEDIIEFISDDEHFIDENFINILDFDLMIKNDLLYESLRRLEKNHRDIIYLSICKEWSDKKIGDYMNMSRQKVQRIKVKVLETLRKNMIGDDFDGK